MKVMIACVETVASHFKVFICIPCKTIVIKIERENAIIFIETTTKGIISWPVVIEATRDA